MTVRLTLICSCTLAFCLAVGVGCNSHAFVPDNTTVTYENDFTHTSVTIPEPFSSKIISSLNEEPFEAKRNTSMGLDTRKYLQIGERTFQVMGNELVLLDDWGYRVWQFSNVESTLDDILANANTK